MEHDGWALPAQADGMWHYFERHANALRSLCGKWTLESSSILYAGNDQNTHNCEECRTLPRGKQ